MNSLLQQRAGLTTQKVQHDACRQRRPVAVSVSAKSSRNGLAVRSSKWTPGSLQAGVGPLSRSRLITCAAQPTSSENDSNKTEDEAAQQAEAAPTPAPTSQDKGSPEWNWTYSEDGASLEQEAAPAPVASQMHVPANLKEDIQARLFTGYKSDITDAFNAKCVASTLFMFFACLAPAISFGALLSTLTNNAIGAVEMIVATAVSGVTYALLSGQPLTIIGSTGPVVTFTAILYAMSQKVGADFLVFYGWVGMWSAGILAVCAFTGASNTVKHITRFTDEIFSGLIAFIFLYEAGSFVVAKNLLNAAVPRTTALLSCLLAALTYTVAKSTADFRTSRWGSEKIRNLVADFGPFTAVVACSAVAVFCFPDISLKTLVLPESFATTTGRPWMTPLLSASPALIFGSFIPAAIGVILLFLDQNITVRIVNSPDFGLKKSCGYHLDMLVLSAVIGFQSLLGLPWMVASTAPSIIHLRSLATVRDATPHDQGATGEVIDVKEQRLTGLGANALIGCSILLMPVLKCVPIAVLSGLFLHLGLQTAKGNQFIERVGLMLVDKEQRAKHMPAYLRGMSMGTINKFTMIQFACFASLWAVKESGKYGILFPLVILAFVPLRFAFDKVFEKKDLDRLDPFGVF